MRKVKVGESGGSLFVRLSELKELQANKGDCVEVELKDNTIIIKKGIE